MTVIRGVDTGPVSIPTLHPMHRRSPAATTAAIRAADLIVIVECDVPYIPRSTAPNPDATIVHIDPDPLKSSMPLWAFPVDLAITADAGIALRQLVVAIDAIRVSSEEVATRFRERVADAKDGEPLPPAPSGDGHKIQAIDVMYALNGVLSAEDIIVEEAVTNSGLLYQHLVRSQQGTIAGAFAPGLARRWVARSVRSSRISTGG